MKILTLFTTLLLFSSIGHVQTSEQLAKSHNPNTYFDINTLDTLIQQSTAKSASNLQNEIRDFFSSASFAIDPDTIWKIEYRADLFKQFLERSDYISISSYLRVSRPRYIVTTPVNMEFLVAIMNYYSSQIQIVFELGQNSMNPKKFKTPKEMSAQASAYAACLQTMAVGGLREKPVDCYLPLVPFLNSNVDLRNKFESAFMNAYRISILHFAALDKNTIISDLKRSQLVIFPSKDNEEPDYDTGFAAERLAGSSVFNRSDLETIPACQRIRLIGSQLKLQDVLSHYFQDLEFSYAQVLELSNFGDENFRKSHRSFRLKSACPFAID